MSTNYYLHRDPKPCPTCHRDQEDSEVHIGKSSGGWVFSWRGWREGEWSPFGKPITTPGELIQTLTVEIANGAMIKDEYHRTVSLGELIDLVVSKRGGRRHSDLDTTRTDHVDGDDISFTEFS